MSTALPAIDTLDAKALEESIKRLRTQGAADRDQLEWVCDAAEAWLATLPRTKEVEVVRWVVVADGRFHGSWTTEEEARAFAEYKNGDQVVRLSGTATVPA